MAEQEKCYACNKPIGDKYGTGQNGPIHWDCYDKMFPRAATPAPVPQGHEFDAARAFWMEYRQGIKGPFREWYPPDCMYSAMAEFAKLRAAQPAVDEEAERREFETWMLSDKSGFLMPNLEFYRGKYLLPQVSALWRCWLARAGRK